MTVSQEDIDLIAPRFQGTAFEDLPEHVQRRVERVSQDEDRMTRMRERQERVNQAQGG